MAGKIELKAPLNGVVTLEPEDTASNYTVTIPAVTSTLVNTASDIEAQVKTATNATGDAPIYACRAWVNFDGTATVAIRTSGNVSSITDNGVGDYTVNFTTAMPDADYAVSGLIQPSVTNNGSDSFAARQSSNASSVNLIHFEDGTRQDSLWVSVAIFR